MQFDAADEQSGTREIRKFVRKGMGTMERTRGQRDDGDLMGCLSTGFRGWETKTRQDERKSSPSRRRCLPGSCKGAAGKASTLSWTLAVGEGNAVTHNQGGMSPGHGLAALTLR